ncbi:hypothetical protein ACFFF5_02720 [Lederbergia wuyishanensis]|uniref:Uncharacterized protein n=1 Tax=Lederbergia wuyishanensis TaxID=1347903 RepID=A0ABU0D0E6_9BACI|nr:hypothetical protein [Lederbergia wuyishanensis]MDQ0341882.1 hypothetical protein [Lederbergia wuyishanensis]
MKIYSLAAEGLLIASLFLGHAPQDICKRKTSDNPPLRLQQNEK